MITNIYEEKLLIISDLHAGSPYYKAKQRTLDLIRHAREHGYSLCLNGDVIDVVQSTPATMSDHASDLLRAFRRHRDAGLNVYYVVGNHDLAMENFLEDWGSFSISPFLNVHSGNKRIRIEHGHLYDPIFSKDPDFYQWITKFAGYFVKSAPFLYDFYMNILRRFLFNADVDENGLYLREKEAFFSAANELSERGFDYVIFGHTHRPTVLPLECNGVYCNPGGWVSDRYFITIDHGQLALQQWASRQVAPTQLLVQPLRLFGGIA